MDLYASCAVMPFLTRTQRFTYRSGAASMERVTPFTVSDALRWPRGGHAGLGGGTACEQWL
jgi:hypothetical protein